jgi:hypothetical protein
MLYQLSYSRVSAILPRRKEPSRPASTLGRGNDNRWKRAEATSPQPSTPPVRFSDPYAGAGAPSYTSMKRR